MPKLPKLERLMKKNGIKVENHNYTYGKYTIKELSPFNIGTDAEGNIKFIDAYVE